MIQSTGYISGETVIWQLSDDQLDFSLSEFQTLISAIKKRGLFAYLDEERPALKSRLLGLFEQELENEEMELDELEYELEDRLRALALRVL